jgi:hypothetical protein
VVLATVADVVDVLVLFWQVDDVHLQTLLFFFYIPKTKIMKNPTKGLK